MSPHDEQTPRPHSTFLSRRKGPPGALRISTPPPLPGIALMKDDNSPSASASSSTLNSANSDSDSPPPFPPPLNMPRPMRNTKRLSLSLPSAGHNKSAVSLSLLPDPESAKSDIAPPSPSATQARRRPSVLSLPSNSRTAPRLHRKDEDDSPTVPYLDGPIEILPGLWLGSEDNARDLPALSKRGIRSILNVAKEVTSPFDSAASSQPLRPFVSAPNLKDRSRSTETTFYPAHGPTGRPSMHYLKLPWSHGQANLVHEGFVDAMTFVDAALARGDGVLVHCQCGVSRSATVVIALVMRAAAQELPSVPQEVWNLKSGGMHGAYDYVKEKSKWAGPNMSLIYQLLDYERVLNGTDKSPSASLDSSGVAEDDEEWGRRRRLMEDESSILGGDDDRESLEVMREARALDIAMEERFVSRKASASSIGSSTGAGMGSAWKSRYRASSVTSNFTSTSILDENLIEEGEEPELLGVGGGFRIDAPSMSTRSPSGETTESSSDANTNSSTSPDWRFDDHPTAVSRKLAVANATILEPSLKTARPEWLGKQRSFTDGDLQGGRPPPSAPATKATFGFVSRLSFKTRMHRTQQPATATLPTVPSSPVVTAPPEELSASLSRKDEVATAKDPRRRVPPPLRLLGVGSGPPPQPPPRSQSRPSSRSSSLASISSSLSRLSTVSTPSQTLFVFPPSPTGGGSLKLGPHMVTLTSDAPFSPGFTGGGLTGVPTPRVSSFKGSNGRRRSFIGLGAPMTPTTACSRVDARGWVGLGGT